MSWQGNRGAAAHRVLKVFSGLMMACMLMAGAHAGATERGSLELSQQGVLSYCLDGNCQAVTVPAQFNMDVDSGYENAIPKNILGRDYVALTTGSSVNACGKFYLFDAQALKATAAWDQPLCNVKVLSGRLVSAYRDAGKWHEKVFDAEGDRLTLLYEDECVGCGYVKRTRWQGDKPDSLLVTDVRGYDARQPLKAKVVADKASLYSASSEDAKTKMYLVKGDEVTLLADAVTGGTFWFFSEYVTASGKVIRKWVKDADVSYK